MIFVIGGIKMSCNKWCDVHLEGVLSDMEFNEFSMGINSAKRQFPELPYIALTNGTCAGCHEHLYYDNRDYCVNQPLIKDLSSRGFFDNYREPKHEYRID